MGFFNDHAGILIIISIIITSILIFILVIVHKSDTIKLPIKTVANLPTKIFFEKSERNEYGVGTFILDVFTIGGHGRLKDARALYEQHYFSYALAFNKSIDLRISIHNQLNSIGEYTYFILNELEESRKLLNRPQKKGFNNHQVIKYNKASDNVFQLKSIATTKANTGVILLQGSTLGGLAAVGSWTLVSLLGTASTGTAIASLSGIAAHNAILAWFGGGALVAGGGGMAVGTLTLGAIVAVPIVIFSAYKTHSKASEIEVQINELIPESNKIALMNKELTEIDKIIHEQVINLKKQYEKIRSINEQVNNMIYPNGAVSKIKRNIEAFFQQDFYTKQEASELDRLVEMIDETFEFLSNNQKV